MESSTVSAPGPGWYPDPNDPSTNRYWDGGRWTENRTPVGPANVAVGTPIGKEQHASGTVVAGYIFAVLMPLIGFIIGLTQINRSRHGIWVVVVSVVAFFLWFAIVASSGSGGGGGGYYR
jgi:Protein of unknown function (DUF2510)